MSPVHCCHLQLRNRKSTQKLTGQNGQHPATLKFLLRAGLYLHIIPTMYHRWQGKEVDFAPAIYILPKLAGSVPVIEIHFLCPVLQVRDKGQLVIRTVNPDNVSRSCLKWLIHKRVMTMRFHYLPKPPFVIHLLVTTDERKIS